MAQDHPERPVPRLVVGVEEIDIAGHAHDVDQPVDASQLAPGRGHGGLDVVAVAGVADPRHAPDLVGDLLGQLLLVVDAEDPGAGRGEGVRRLASDALACSDDDNTAAVEPEQPRVVGDG